MLWASKDDLFEKFQIYIFFNDKKIRNWARPDNDMQILPNFPPSKVAKLGFRSKKMRNVLKPMDKQFSEFYFIEKWLILY